MKSTSIVYGVRVGLVAGVFAAGFFFGSASERRANAQLGDLGKAAVQAAGESGGAVGSATQLGTTIVDMQSHVDALEKSLGVLTKIKTSLGG